MMNRYFFFVILLAMAAGCSPIQRTLVSADLEKIKLNPRNVVIDAVEVTDVRPTDEKTALKPKTRYFVPALIWWQSATEGHYRPDAKYYSQDVPGEMQILVENAIENSELVKQESDDDSMHINIKVEIQHLYGITHGSSAFVASLGAASSATKDFAPYGFAAASVTVEDTKGVVLSQRIVTGQFDPDLSEYLGMTVVSKGSVSNQLTLAAVQASGHLAGNIAKALEPILAQHTTSDAPAVSSPIFFISRATNDGLYAEVASIELESGNVVSSQIFRRKLEACCAIDEWVVDPYQGGDAMLSDENYGALIKRLQARFDVRYITNIRVAHFFGSQPNDTQAALEAANQLVPATTDVITPAKDGKKSAE